MTEQGAGERKLATLLFADLSGYTDLTRRLDPEDVMSLVEPVMRDLQRIAENHGGTVLMVAGDGVLCAFGVPHTREDDALRAVRAAVEMRSRTGVDEETPGMHAGLASGEVLVAPDSSPRGWGMTGLCIAMATRLADRAADGVILVDPVCRRLAGSAVEWGEEHRIPLQGMGEAPVVVSEVVDVGVTPVTQPDATFVDRLAERARLDNRLSSVRTEGRSRLLAIWGDAGTGKSSLIRDWCQGLDNARALVGTCRSYGAARPLAAVLDPVIEYLTSEGLLEPEALEDLVARVAPVEAPAVARRLLALAGVLPDSPPAEDPGGAVAEGVRTLLSAMSADAPLVLAIDDAQWAGDDIKSLLADLHRNPVEGQLLVVVLSRDSEAQEVAPLGPLPDWAITELITGRVGRPDPELVSSLIARTGGNPLYIEECIRHLLEAGVIEEQDGACVIVSSAGLEGLPTSVRALIAARFDSLPAGAKDVALVASASADVAPVATLRAICSEHEVDEALEVLISRGLVQEVLGGGIRFRHRLLQEVAYAALTRARRVHLHLTFLDLLEQDALSLRAFHAEAAWSHLGAASAARPEVAARAVRELRLLGEMVFGWQASGALGVFARAEPMLEHLPAEAAADAALLLAAKAQALIDLGRFSEAKVVASRAVVSALATGETRPEASARLALGHALTRLNEHEPARVELSQVLALADALWDRQLRGRASWALAHSWRFDSRPQFRALLEQAYEELVAADDQWGRAQVARLLTYLLSMSGGEDFEHWRGLVSEMQSLDDLRGRAMLARITSFVASGRADWAAAAAAAEEALATGRRAGLQDVVTDALLILMQSKTMLGLLAPAAAARQELLATTGLTTRSRQALSCASALTLLRSGARDEAAEELRTAADLLRELGHGERLLERQAVAEVALDAGHSELAAQAGVVAAELAEESGLHLVALQLHLLVHRAMLAVGRQAEGWEVLQAAAAAAGAGPIARQAVLLRDQQGGTSDAPALQDDGIEARAIWFENAAMRASDDEEARDSWQRAHDEWSRLGHTIWPIRALKAKEALPRNAQELAKIPLTPLLADLTAPPSDA